MTDTTPTFFSDRAEELLDEFSGCLIRWLVLITDECRFFRLTRKYYSRGIPSSPSYLGEGKTLVAIAIDKTAEPRQLLLIYYRHTDFEAEAYLKFPDDPTAKPTEAVGASYFFSDGRLKEVI